MSLAGSPARGSPRSCPLPLPQPASHPHPASRPPTLHRPQEALLTRPEAPSLPATSSASSGLVPWSGNPRGRALRGGAGGRAGGSARHTHLGLSPRSWVPVAPAGPSRPGGRPSLPLPTCWLGEVTGTVSMPGEPGLPDEEGTWSGERRATCGQQGSPLLRGPVSGVKARGKSVTAALEGSFPKAPREPGRRSCKGVNSRAQDPQENGSGATDRRFLQTPQDTEPVAPLDWPGGCLSRWKEGVPLPSAERGTIPLGMGSETPAEPGSQTQPSRAPREARPSRPEPPGKLLPGDLHPPHLGSLDQPTLHPRFYQCTDTCESQGG